MFGHRVRRWPNIGPTLGRCLVFAGSRPHGPPQFSERRRVGALGQWLKLSALKVEDRGFEPYSALQVSLVKIQYSGEPP